METFLAIAALLITVGSTAISYSLSRKAMGLQAEQAKFARESYAEQMEITRGQLGQLEEDRRLWEERTEEQREVYQSSMAQVGDILGGKTQIEDSPMFASQFAQLQKGYEQERNRILDTVREGGRRDRLLRDLSRSYSDVRQSFAGDVQKQVFNWASTMGLPTGKPGPAIGMPGVSGGGGGYVPLPVDPTGSLKALGYLSEVLGKEDETVKPTVTTLSDTERAFGMKKPPAYDYGKV